LATDSYRRNRILAQLPRAEAARIQPFLEKVDLNFKEQLFDSGQRIDHVYFMLTGVISLLVTVDGEQPIEAATVGYEGMVGLPAFLGASAAPWRALCQVPGEGLRMSVARLRPAARDTSLERLLLQYANTMMSMLAQTAACNRLHSLEERMCRWLLLTHDRVDSDTFALTQEFLGQMLGVRRPSVSLAGSALQRAGLIRYSRGRITITNRAGLEDAACECYARVERQFKAGLSANRSRR
jgi:CRP-like cAMP-binding protein